MKTTLAEIAELANVSKMTVSRVLTGKGQVAEPTQRRILEIIEDLGYQPNWMARSLASRRSMILGVLIPKIEHMFLDNYIAQVLSGVMDVALRENYQVLLYPVNANSGNNMEYLNVAKTKLLDGMILLKTKVNDQNISTLATDGFPFVLVNHKKYSDSIHFVDSQNIQGARMAVQYLYEKGHRKIAFVCGSMDETNGIDRLQGFREAMNNYGLGCNENWIIEGDFNQDMAYSNSCCLFSGNEKPTAVFCADDYMAIGVMHRLKELGLSVPEDVAIIGFDDIEMAEYIRPSLTTIRQPICDLGKCAAEILLETITSKPEKPVHRLLDVELIQRESA